MLETASSSTVTQSRSIIWVDTGMGEEQKGDMTKEHELSFESDGYVHCRNEIFMIVQIDIRQITQFTCTKHMGWQLGQNKVILEKSWEVYQQVKCLPYKGKDWGLGPWNPRGSWVDTAAHL